MAASSDPPAAGVTPGERSKGAESQLEISDTAPVTADVGIQTGTHGTGQATSNSPHEQADKAAKQAGATIQTHNDYCEMNPLDFHGSVDSNNQMPSAETLRKIENYVVLDRDGKSHPFKSLYTGKHVARRVLIIFVRHFFCGVSFLLVIHTNQVRE